MSLDLTKIHLIEKRKKKNYKILLAISMFYSLGNRLNFSFITDMYVSNRFREIITII